MIESTVEKSPSIGVNSSAVVASASAAKAGPCSVGGGGSGRLISGVQGSGRLVVVDSTGDLCRLEENSNGSDVDELHGEGESFYELPSSLVSRDLHNYYLTYRNSRKIFLAEKSVTAILAWGALPAPAG